MSTFICFSNLIAQYPQHFTYDDENGLPCNEVYSILQDHKGFIWLGTGVGLYKYDGVRYHLYNSPKQKTNSAANLVMSSSGNIYYMNFKHQVFVMSEDSLVELNHSMTKINNLLADDFHQIWFTHDKGVSVFNEKTQQWRSYNDFGMENSFGEKSYCNAIRKVSKDDLKFINTSGIGSIKYGKYQQLFQSDTLILSGKYMIEPLDNKLILFHTDGQSVHEINGDEITPFENAELVKSISNRKITNIKTLADGNIWICTYSGIIQYNPKSGQSRSFYPQIAFSDILLDRENNYWFTTLQAGVFRVPNMNYLIWNNSNNEIVNEKLTLLTSDNQHIFFANVNGLIQRLDLDSYEIYTYPNQLQSDIQSLNYLNIDASVCYYQGVNCYRLLDKDVHLLIPDKISSVKFTAKIQNEYFFATSSGLIIYNPTQSWTGEPIFKSWCRQLIHSPTKSIVSAASNDGLIRLKNVNNTWQILDTLLPSIQINSFDLNVDQDKLFLLTYDSQIEIFENDLHLETIPMPKGIQAKKIQHYKDKLYLATNQGLLIYDLITKKFIQLDRLAGIASNNIQDLLIVKNQLWLATGKGLQSLPLPIQTNSSSALVYLKNKELVNHSLILDYGSPLILRPEVSSYSSQSNFSYFYKVNNNSWIELPANIEQIEILNLPSGDFKILLKAVDHIGNNSENTISIKGRVYPPFWERWWFILTITSLVGLIVYYFVRRELNKQRKEMKRLNELNLAKLTAIRSQMNPHFMFNTLNSLQDLILKQDFKNTNYYLTKFASLMRMILHNSEVNDLQLSNEVKMIQMYLELEQLRFGDDFTFRIDIQNSCNIENLSIPTMMIQPYIENAIKHGLLHKKGQKTLIVTFWCKDNDLICTIEDNGIGRKKSAEINARQHPDHQSFSSEANQNRAVMLTNNSNKNYSIEIIDLEENGMTKGTKVILHIPFKGFDS